MANGGSIKLALSKPERFSYLFMAGMLILTGCLHMATPLLVALFSYFALTKIHFVKRWPKWPAAVAFLVLAAALAYGVGRFISQTVRDLPEIADNAVPKVIQWAEQHHIELPFTDYDSLKDLVMGT